MRFRTIVLLAFVTLIAAGAACACTNLFVATGGARLVGANLDCGVYFPRVWFIPSGDGRHGRFCYGTDEEQRIAEGGVNDQGLFIGVNAIDADTGWRADPALPDWEDWEGWYGSGVPDGILARCATVDEAVAVFRGYNLFTLAHVKFLIADRGGASVVVEWSDGGLRFLERGADDFQLATNFVQSDHAAGEVPCERYRIARKMLSGGAVPATFDGVRRILSATHLEFRTPTVVSSICDLETGECRLYYFHDFEQPVVLDLREELSGDRHGGLVGDLVPFKPYVATVYEGHAATGSGE